MYIEITLKMKIFEFIVNNEKIKDLASSSCYFLT